MDVHSGFSKYQFSPDPMNKGGLLSTNSYLRMNAEIMDITATKTLGSIHLV